MKIDKRQFGASEEWPEQFEETYIIRLPTNQMSEWSSDIYASRLKPSIKLKKKMRLRAVFGC